MPRRGSGPRVEEGRSFRPFFLQASHKVPRNPAQVSVSDHIFRFQFPESVSIYAAVELTRESYEFLSVTPAESNEKVDHLTCRTVYF